MFSSCRCSPPSSAAPASSSRRSPGSHMPSRPQSRRLTSRSLLRSLVGLRTPSAPRSRLGLRHLRARLPHEVPGSGLSAPVLPWPSKTTRAPRSIAESSRRPRTRSAEATLRPSARQPAGVPSAETWPSLPTQRQAEGPNRVAFERGDCGEPSGSAGQRQSGQNPELLGFVWVLNPLIASRSPSETGFRGPAFLHSAGGDLCGLREREPRRGEVL